jgi:hypothetical protein
MAYMLLSVIKTVGYNGVDLLNLINVSGSNSLDQLYIEKLCRNSYIRITAGLRKEERDLGNGVGVIIISGFDNIDLIISVVLSVINIGL